MIIFKNKIEVKRCSKKKRKIMSFSDYIKNLRLKNNISLWRVKKESGFPIENLERLEKDYESLPPLNIMEKLAPIYKVSLHKIIYDYYAQK